MSAGSPAGAPRDQLWDWKTAGGRAAPIPELWTPDPTQHDDPPTAREGPTSPTRVGTRLRRAPGRMSCSSKKPSKIARNDQELPLSFGIWLAASQQLVLVTPAGTGSQGRNPDRLAEIWGQ